MPLRCAASSLSPSLAFRAAPDAREIELVRAMAIEVRRSLDRVRRQLVETGRPQEEVSRLQREREGAERRLREGAEFMKFRKTRQNREHKMSAA